MNKFFLVFFNKTLNFKVITNFDHFYPLRKTLGCQAWAVPCTVTRTSGQKQSDTQNELNSYDTSGLFLSD